MINLSKLIHHKVGARLWPIVDLCEVLQVSQGTYYYWKRKPAKPIMDEELLLYRETKRLFYQTRRGDNRGQSNINLLSFALFD
jgi:hypothetical protein